MRGHCTPEQQERCPLYQHFQDTHHLAYPRSDYRTGVEKRWRELDFNKVSICRGLHNAIHESGYLPEKPTREEMLTEIWTKDIPERATREADLQQFIGRNFMNGDVA